MIVLKKFVATLIAISFAVSAPAQEPTEQWLEVAQLSTPRSGFGTVVSIRGDRMAIGAFGDTKLGLQSGSVYVFERQLSDGWVQVAKLLPLDGGVGWSFGDSVSIDGDRLAIGAWGNRDLGIDSGAVYLFERSELGDWAGVAKLLASDGVARDSFGDEVALSGETLVVGAPFASTELNQPGAAYVFERGPDGSWHETNKLAGSEVEASDLFGWSTSVDDNALVVGSFRSKKAYVFERDLSGGWIETAILTGPDSGFGQSVAIRGDQIVVGAQRSSDLGFEAGTAYIFERSADGDWIETAKLLASDGRALEEFGRSVALDNDRVVIGSRGSDNKSGLLGAVYVFERNLEGSWEESAKLEPSDGASDKDFSVSIAIDADRLVAGAPFEQFPGLSDSSYTFELVTIEPTIDATGTCPGLVALTVGGGSPLGQAILFRSAQSKPGATILPTGPCAGEAIDLLDAQLLVQATLDANGNFEVERATGVSQCGAFLQLVDASTCETSDVTQLPE